MIRGVGTDLEVYGIVGPPDGPPIKFLQPRLVWGEFSCNEIVDMIRYPGPEDGWWWLDEEALKDNQPTDVL